MRYPLVLLSLVMLAGRAAALPADSLAGRVVRCVDFRSGDDLDIHAQHVSATGSVDAAWEPDASRLCVGTASEVASVRVSDGAGGALVAWVDTRVEEGDIYAQHLLAGGGVAPGWPAHGLALCAAPGSQYGLAVTADGAGGAVVAWMDFRDGRHAQVRAQRVSGAGSVLWTSDGVQVAPDSSDQTAPALLADGSGGAYVVWSALRSDRGELLLAHLGAAGAPDPTLPAAGLALVAGPGRRASPRLVPRPSGAWLVWEETADSTAIVRVLALGPLGDAEPSWPQGGRAVSPAGDPASLSSALADTSGGVIVVWCAEAAGLNRVRAQRVGVEGAALWQTGGLGLCDEPAEQYSPAIAPDGHGGLLVAWEDYRAGGDADIWAQRVTATGERVWGDRGAAVCVQPRHQFAPTIAPDGAGGGIVTWVDGPQSARASYLRSRPAGEGTVPRLVSAVAAPGRAELAWRTEPGDARTLTVLRMLGGGEWKELAAQRPDESGLLGFVDHGLAPGTAVTYRLASLEPPPGTYYAEVRLEIPSPQPLALRAAHALAGGRGVRLVFTLQTDEPAAFEVFDVQGRLLAAHALDTQGAGEYALEVPLSRQLAGGLYFVRLRQGRALRTARMVVIR